MNDRNDHGMNPNRAEEADISRYLFSEMTPEEKASFEERVKNDSALGAELAQLRATVALVEKHDTGDEVLDGAARTRLLEAAAKVEAKEGAQASRGNVKAISRGRWLQWAAAVVMLAGGSALAWTLLQEEDSPVGETHTASLGDVSKDTKEEIPESFSPSPKKEGEVLLRNDGLADGEIKFVDGRGVMLDALSQNVQDLTITHAELGDTLTTLSSGLDANASNEALWARIPEDVRTKSLASMTNPDPSGDSKTKVDAAILPNVQSEGTYSSSVQFTTSPDASQASAMTIGGGGGGGGGQYRGPGDSVAVLEESKLDAKTRLARPAQRTTPQSLVPRDAYGVPNEPATTDSGIEPNATTRFYQLQLGRLTWGEPEPATFGDADASGESSVGWYFDGTTDRLGSEVQALVRKGFAGGDVSGQPDAEAIQSKIETLFRSLARRPEETPQMMFFRYWGDNSFVESSHDTLSTIAVDVDTASYTLVRNYLQKGMLPPPEAVRTEELVNFFKSAMKSPEKGVFRIATEWSASPFGHDPKLKILKVGVKGREISREQRRACALTFVIDVSGSMRQENRLELVKKSLRLLVEQLDEGDSVGIVAFSTSGYEVLKPVSVAESDVILAAIDSLSPDGSTNAGEGLVLGYEMAAKQFIDGGNNRVILCSDGVANTGITNHDQMLAQIDGARQKGIFMNSIGVGMGNHNDHLMEQLANKGDGVCFYVDDIKEARRVFVDELTGTLQTIARDVKIQLEFDPQKVIRFRQLGYENRQLAHQDFRNDKVDAGEVGAGHEVVALYEVMLQDDVEGALGEVRVRYKDVDLPEEVSEINHAIDATTGYESFEAAPARFQLSVVAAEFSELLRRSYWANSGSFKQIVPHVDRIAAALPADASITEFAALVRQADVLRGAEPDDLAKALHQLKENQWLTARLEDRLKEQKRETLDQLEKQNEVLRGMVKDLLEAEWNR